MSAPPTPKSSWSRMRGAVRRASTVLIATKPPSISGSDRDADSASIKGSIKASSIKGIATNLLPSKLLAPSPIAESPARENEATRDDPAPPAASPLSQSQTVQPIPLSAPVSDPSPAPASESDLEEYTPPPLIDSTATGPGGFTDDVDDLPQSQVAHDPFAQPPTVALGEPSQQDDASAPAPVVTLEPGPVLFPEPTAAPPAPAPTVPATSEAALLEPAALPEPAAAPEPAPTVPATPEPRSYFDIPLVDEPVDDLELSPTSDAFKQAAEEDVFLVESAPAAPAETSRELLLEDPAQPQPPTLVEDEPAPLPAVMPEPEHDPAVTLPLNGVFPLPIPMSMPGFDVGSSQDVWAVPNKPAHGSYSRSIGNGDASFEPQQSDAPVVYQDPFADPIAPRITVSDADYDYPSMPAPQVIDPHTQDASAAHSNGSTPVGIVMSLPPIHNVLPSRSLHDSPRTPKNRIETDETLPLLSRPGSPKGTYLRPPSNTTPHVVTVSPLAGAQPATSSAWTLQSSSIPRLHELGWIEYQLPDSTVYCVHPTRRVTTDIDLRDDRKLDAVMAFLEHHRATVVPLGMELWIREGKFTKKRFAPIIFWVDHGRRIVVLHHERQNGDVNSRGRKNKNAEDDPLDTEYRYWSFIESHPAHTSLPSNTRAEALDVLTWAWTDRLLPSHRSVPAPFTQDECQELMSLLRSFGSDQGDFGLQAVVHTRIIARILLRVAHWRQQFFRPNKPLPTDVGNNSIPIPKRRRPFPRAVFDFVISCLCLGIPYFFFERHRQVRFDQESGGLRSPGPILVLSACTCLIAAIVLSASVTFLSLPGLDSLARIAGFVAILCASFSITSTAVAVFRFKSDLERPAAAVGMEGLMLLSRRSFVLSLPLVFLAYAIIGFITGVVLYSFRGVSTDPLLPMRPFDDNTRWTVVGVLGGLAGVLSTSLLLLGS